MKLFSHLFTFTLLYFLTFTFSSCVLDSPTEMPRDNPNDGRNPGVIPDVISINTSAGNGYTNSINTQVYLEFRAASQIRIGEVASQGSNLDVTWQEADTVVNIQIQSGDGEKWIGCQAKALNGNESAVKYASIKLDTRASISSFAWNSTGGDTLVPDDRVTFTLRTNADAFGAETDGSAEAMVDGWDGIDLVGQADGSYVGSYTITDDTPKVFNALVVVSFTDRAGNAVSEETDETLTAWWTLAPGTERSFPLGNSGESIVMCWIPAGSFNMGSPGNEQDRDGDEDPVHRVTLSEGFWLGKYEVTQAQWEAVMGDNPAHDYGVGDNHPVYYVSWTDIQGFESALGNAFRLPSESEWEYACRAGTTARFYWGDDANYSSIGNYAVYSSNDPGGTANVGTKQPNSWGLYDMSGNVWEWCEDWYHSDYTNAPSDGSAWISPSGSIRVYRGGCWTNHARSCRSAYRSSIDPSYRYINLGFRLARSL